MLNLTCFLSVKLKCLCTGCSGPLYRTACCLSASLVWVRLAWLGGSLKTVCSLLWGGAAQRSAMEPWEGTLPFWRVFLRTALKSSCLETVFMDNVWKACLLFSTYGNHNDDGGDNDWSCSAHLCQTLCPRTLHPSIIHLALIIILWEVL